MMKQAVVFVLGIPGLLLCFLEACDLPGDSPPLPEEQKGVEVLTRGPIHEAFAEPLSVDPRPNPIIQQKPPADIEELPPDQKPEGTHIQWIPGYFAWDETGNDYIWISGFWRATPPGKQWMPGHWHAEGDGWQWVSGYWAVEGQEEVEYLPAPPQSIDMGPSVAAPDADSLYTPGCWVYQQRRCLWRPGFWLKARPDWCHVPAQYAWTPAGCIFLEGYWDFPLAQRGMLFAPAHFGREAAAPGWQYRPRYVLGSEFVMGSLFARPEFGRYYCGDYYAPEYARLGFVPWFDHRMGRNIPDPFFQNARLQARTDPKWEQKFRNLHKDRLAEVAPRPPITLVQQIQVINDITTNKSVKIGKKVIAVADPKAMIGQMTLIAPLAKVDAKKFKLLPVDKAKEAEGRKAIAHIRAAAVERNKAETNLISKGAHPTKPADPPAKVKVEFLKVPGPAKIVHVEKPPAPVIPKHVEKPLPKQEVIKPLRIDPPKGKGKDAPKKDADKPAPKKDADKPAPKKDADKPAPKKDADKPAPKSKDADKLPEADELGTLTPSLLRRATNRRRTTTTSRPSNVARSSLGVEVKGEDGTGRLVEAQRILDEADAKELLPL